MRVRLGRRNRSGSLPTINALRRALIALVTVVVLGSTGDIGLPRVVVQADAEPSICDPAQVMLGCPESTPTPQCDPAQVMLGCPDQSPPAARRLSALRRPALPPPGGWRGIVIIEYTRATTDSTTTDYGSGSYISNSHDESTTITDTYELTGLDGPIARPEETPPPPPGCQYGAQPGELICEEEETPPPPPGCQYGAQPGELICEEEETPPPPPGCQYGAQPGELICEEEETPPPPPGCQYGAQPGELICEEEETPPPPPGCQYGAQPGELICEEEETPPPPPGCQYGAQPGELICEEEETPPPPPGCQYGAQPGELICEEEETPPPRRAASTARSRASSSAKRRRPGRPRRARLAPWLSLDSIPLRGDSPSPTPSLPSARVQSRTWVTPIGSSAVTTTGPTSESRMVVGAWPEMRPVYCRCCPTGHIRSHSRAEPLDRPRFRGPRWRRSSHTAASIAPPHPPRPRHSAWIQLRRRPCTCRLTASAADRPCQPRRHHLWVAVRDRG